MTSVPGFPENTSARERAGVEFRGGGWCTRTLRLRREKEEPKRRNPGSVLTEEIVRAWCGRTRASRYEHEEFPLSCWGEGRDDFMGNAEQIKK